MPEVQETFFKILNPDGTFAGRGNRSSKKGKIWNTSAVKLHLRLNESNGPDWTKEVHFDLDEPNAEVIEYETVIKTRTPIKEFIRKMHIDSEKKGRFKKYKRILVFDDEVTDDT